VEREEGGIRVEDQEGVVPVGLLLMDTYPPQGGVLQVVAIQVMVVVARQTTPATTEVAAGTNTAAKRRVRSNSHLSPLADSGGNGVVPPSKPSTPPLGSTTTRP
jgi:hypothetical protein